MPRIDEISKNRDAVTPYHFHTYAHMILHDLTALDYITYYSENALCTAPTVCETDFVWRAVVETELLATSFYLSSSLSRYV
jgi:hypothetical protein